MTPFLRKADRKYVALLVGLVGLLLLAEYYAPKALDWRRTYDRNDKIPYGNFLLYNLLPSFFNAEVKPQAQTLYETAQEVKGQETEGLWCIVTEKFTPDSLDTNALLQIVNAGGEIFIASTWFSEYFADTLHLGTSRSFSFFLNGGEDEEDIHAVDSVAARLLHPSFQADSALYYFRKGTTSFYFDQYTRDSSIVLGETTNGYANFIKIPFGEGNIWLHANPLIFTNYNMVQPHTREYIERVLSHLPQKPTLWWDEYYQSGRNELRTPLRFILQNEPLRWGYYTLLLTLLIFILFQGKRRQRIIPIVLPPVNTSLEFVETIGQLYFQQKNHTDLAKKKILFFKEYLRTYFYIGTTTLGEIQATKVSARAQLSQEQVSRLFEQINRLENQKNISEAELSSLSEAIERFRNRSKV